MEIVEKPGFQVIGIQVEATWDDLWQQMPAAWEQLRERLDEIPNRTGTPLMDICLHRDEGIYRQVVGAEVSNTDTVPDGMVAVDIPEQTFLHDRHTGSLPEIAESFGKIYNYARERDYPVDDFKLDIGYTADGSLQPHDLYVRVTGNG